MSLLMFAFIRVSLLYNKYYYAYLYLSQKHIVQEVAIKFNPIKLYNNNYYLNIVSIHITSL